MRPRTLPAVALLGVTVLAGCTDPPIDPPREPPVVGPTVVTSLDPTVLAGPGGSYAPVGGVCARIDLAAAQQLAGPLRTTTSSDDVTIPGSFTRVECEFKGERKQDDGTRTVYVRVTAEMFGAAQTAMDSYERAAKEVNTGCWKEHDSRTRILELGARAYADQCLDPDGAPPSNLYELEVVDDNLYLRVTIHAFDSTTLPAEQAVADAARAAARSVLTGLRKP
jgi:hypothetical protein